MKKLTQQELSEEQRRAACWMCRGIPMPREADSCARFALCDAHLRARTASIMAQRGKPATSLVR